MSTAAAAAADAPEAPKKSKKKLIIIVVAAVVLLAVGGGGAVFMLKKKAHDAQTAEEGDGEAESAQVEHKPAAKHDPKAVPTFVPLDPFTVNLADREAERYAQIGITLELGDPHAADQLKSYMPAVRNNILMVLAHKTSAELLEREGKTKLAEEIRRETERALGIEPADEEEEPAAATAKPKKKKKKKAPEPHLITAVQFSNFIIQ